MAQKKALETLRISEAKAVAIHDHHQAVIARQAIDIEELEAKGMQQQNAIDVLAGDMSPMGDEWQYDGKGIACIAHHHHIISKNG